MEGLRSGGEAGYGAQPSIEFKVRVRTADMKIPCPGQQQGLKKTFDSGVTRMYSIFRLSDSVSNQKPSFEHRIESYCSTVSNWVSSSCSPSGKIFSFVTVV
jgi:hypothetical protein